MGVRVAYGNPISHNFEELTCYVGMKISYNNLGFAKENSPGESHLYRTVIQHCTAVHQHLPPH